MKSVIHNKLKEQLNPNQIDVEDNSHLHVGHAGARPGGDSHFKVSIKSQEFEGKSLIQCHRIINSILAEELKQAIHALEIKIIR
jgi:BolA protein